MKKNIFIKKFSLAVFIFMSAIATYAQTKAESLCEKSENSLFDCKTKGKIASLCLTESTSTNEIIQYRFGTKEKIDLKYPENTNESLKKFYLSSEVGSSIGESRIRFSNGDFNYYLYDITNEGDAYSGIFVQKANKKIAMLECESVESSIKAPAYKLIQREEMDTKIKLVK